MGKELDQKGEMLKNLLMMGALASAAAGGYLAPDLRQAIAGAEEGELIPVFIVVQGDLDDAWVDAVTVGMDRYERRAFVVDALKDLAATSQAGVRELLAAQPEGTCEDVESHWLANSMYCRTTVDVIRQAASLPEVVVVESASDPDAGLIEPVEVRPATPEEQSRAIAWGVSKINADDVWAMGYDGTGVIVGVIDTGTDYNHTDLAANMWHDTPAGLHYGWDFYNNDPDPMDDYGHGTHVSGTVLGDGTGGTQTGVAPGATCMALRINYYSGGENTWIQAMEWGTSHGTDVLTMSLGSTHGNTTLRNAEQNLLAAGVFHSVAAGNSGPGAGTILSSGDSPPPWFHPDQTYHGGQSAVVTCAATDSGDTIASFSSRGPVTWWTDYTTANPLIDPDIAAPGVDVLSTQWTGGYTTMSGTSMATPHVAGVAALMLDANPSLTVAQIDQYMETTALQLGPPGKDNAFGAGRIDAYQAVLAAISTGIGDSMEGIEPSGFCLSSVSPNPVSGIAAFQLYTATAARADISVFDISGRVVTVLSSGEIAPGTHSYIWEVPAGLGNGIYFVRASSDAGSATSRMTILR